jgi:transposase
LVAHEADVRGRGGAIPVPRSIRYLYPWLRHIFADSGCANDKLRAAPDRRGDWSLSIVKRANDAKGFVLVRRRWIVEWSFVWLGRCRRLAKDFEASIASAEAWILVASIRLLTRRVAVTRPAATTF